MGWYKPLSIGKTVSATISHWILQTGTGTMLNEEGVKSITHADVDNSYLLEQ